MRVFSAEAAIAQYWASLTGGAWWVLFLQKLNLQPEEDSMHSY